MSKKLAKNRADNSGSPLWTNLPPDLLLKISSFLPEKTDLIRFRRVCSSWRSSIPPIPNQNRISSLFSGHLLPNGIYLLKNQSLTFILSLHESQPGKFTLRHSLTYKPLIKSVSADSLHRLVSGWTITPLALSHSPLRYLEIYYWERKPCFIPQFHSSFDEECKLYATNGDWLLYSKNKDLIKCYHPIRSFVNFCGCTYAINLTTIYLVNQCGLKRLTCVNPSPPRKSRRYIKRFVVSDGDLYLLFNFKACIPHYPKPNSRHRCRIYKVVLDDLKCPSSYTMESVTSLGDRALFFNWDCSFSIRTRHHLLANRIFIAQSAFPSCVCSTYVGFRVFSHGGKFIRTFQSTHVMFEPPRVWIKKLKLSLKLNGLMDK